MKRLIIIAALVLVTASVVTATVLADTGNHQNTDTTNVKDTQQSLPTLAANQQQLLDAAVRSLEAQGVPVQSAQFTINNQFTPSLIAEFFLQSASSNDAGTPDVPIYRNLIHHEVDLALGRGLNIGAFEITLVNTKGIVLGQLINAANSSNAIISPATPPTAIDETAGYAFLSQNMSFYGMNLINMELAQDQDGLLGLTVNLQVSDLQTANEGINGVYYSVLNTISSFNSSQSKTRKTFRRSSSIRL